MSDIFTVFEQINFLHLLWGFFIVFVVHELEEWNIDQFERQCFTGLPPAATDRSARVWIGVVVLVGLVWVMGPPCRAARLPPPGFSYPP